MTEQHAATATFQLTAYLSRKLTETEQQALLELLNDEFDNLLRCVDPDDHPVLDAVTCLSVEEQP